MAIILYEGCQSTIYLALPNLLSLPSIPSFYQFIIRRLLEMLLELDQKLWNSFRIPLGIHLADMESDLGITLPVHKYKIVLDILK
jgi:hypothetical protein